MIQYLGWAAGYSIFAFPLASGVLANLGILRSPGIGASVMSISIFVVSINAQLLRKASL